MFSEENILNFENACDLVEGCEALTIRPEMMVTGFDDFYRVMVFFYSVEDSYQIEVKSSILNQKLLEKISAATNVYQSKRKEKFYFQPILQFIKNKLSSKLLTAWSEIMELKNLPIEMISTDEKNGIICWKIHEDDYFLTVEIQITENYPFKQPNFKFLESNLPSRALTLFEGKLINLLHSLKNSSQILDEKEEIKTQPTIQELQNIKHDVQFLKQVADLNAVSEIKEKRREKTRLIKSEIEAEKKANSKISTANLIEAKPSLEKMIQFLYSLVVALPKENCPMCKTSLLSKEASTQKELLPELTNCNHWYHLGCLYKYLVSPPFDKPRICHICKEHIHHPKWNNEYIKRMEERYARKMAKERELADVLDLFH